MATGDIIGVLNSDDVFAGPDVIRNICGFASFVPNQIQCMRPRFCNPDNLERITVSGKVFHISVTVLLWVDARSSLLFT